MVKKQGRRSKGLRLEAGDLTHDVDYRHWIGELKARYRAAQIKASIAVNSALIEFYWGLGKDISEKYPGKKRNAHFFENLSNDLLVGIENPKGLSPTNIKYALYFYRLYRPQVADDLVHIPWGHHRYIIDKCHADVDKALFYVRRTVEHNWSRTDLQIQHDAGLFEKTGKSANNFAETLAVSDGHLAKEMVKSEYSFELLESVDEHDERAVERALVKNITRTLTELGGGFAYVGHQVRVTVGGRTFGQT